VREECVQHSTMWRLDELGPGSQSMQNECIRSSSPRNLHGTFTCTPLRPNRSEPHCSRMTTPCSFHSCVRSPQPAPPASPRTMLMLFSSRSAAPHYRCLQLFHFQLDGAGRGSILSGSGSVLPSSNANALVNRPARRGPAWRGSICPLACGGAQPLPLRSSRTAFDSAKK
jgi:hypothetical protein